MNKYTHIFFDLDHTIWDFHKNSEETLHQLHADFNLAAAGISDPALFISTYQRINHQLWADYQKGQISKEHLRDRRFRDAFLEMGYDGEAIVEEFSRMYLEVCPAKNHLLPNAHEVLNHLSKKYDLSIITNGFVEATHIKLQNAGIEQYFSEVFISELIGYNKPDARLFDHVLRTVGAEIADCVMIGDNYDTDIAGAKNVGMAHIYFNPQKVPHQHKVDCEIDDLLDLKKLL